MTLFICFIYNNLNTKEPREVLKGRFHFPYKLTCFFGKNLYG
jgi:hypothetical protein